MKNIISFFLVLITGIILSSCKELIGPDYPTSVFLDIQFTDENGNNIIDSLKMVDYKGEDKYAFIHTNDLNINTGRLETKESSLGIWDTKYARNEHPAFKHSTFIRFEIYQLEPPTEKQHCILGLKSPKIFGDDNEHIMILLLSRSTDEIHHFIIESCVIDGKQLTLQDDIAAKDNCFSLSKYKDYVLRDNTYYANIVINKKTTNK